MLGAVNPHKGSGPAVSFYTWVSGRYAPFYTKVISVSEGEAAHVIDGLLYHGGDVDIAVHHTDGGGVSDHVFALCHLLGFRFAPRIPSLDDRRLHTFGPATTWPTLNPFIAGKIDEALITTYWDDLLRLATSVRLGTVPASLMLRRLGSYPRQNGLALALREVGRIERTLFTLDWLDDPALRRQATAELNKGESRSTNTKSGTLAPNRFIPACGPSDREAVRNGRKAVENEPPMPAACLPTTTRWKSNAGDCLTLHRPAPSLSFLAPPLMKARRGAALTGKIRSNVEISDVRNVSYGLSAVPV